MKTKTVRSWIAFLIIGVFMLMSVIVACYPFLKPNSNLDALASYFSKISSSYSGIIGVIIGYYFARNDNNTAINDRSKGLPLTNDSPIPPTSPQISATPISM